MGKCVELFRDMLPFVHRVAVLLNAEDPFWKEIQGQVQLASQETAASEVPSCRRVSSEGRVSPRQLRIWMTG